MVKFSMSVDESEGYELYDDEGPSRPTPKKQRTTCTQRPEQEEQEEEHEDVAEEEEEGEEEEEENDEYDEEEVESEGEEEEEEEEEEESQNEDENTTYGVSLESNGGANRKNRASLEPNRDGSISVTLTDPDVLDCPICFEPLSIPVFQCENGHIACSSCCIKLGNKCPSCSLPIGYNRCRGIEKVLESVKISCRNVKYGCGETMSYSKKHEHEETCIHAPCSCPLPDCDFVGSFKELSLHFGTKHSNSAKCFFYNCPFSVSLKVDQKYLILREQNDGIIFILNNVIEIIGNLVCVNCIGPRSLKSRFCYDLTARNEGSSVRLHSFAENMPSWFEHLPDKGFLLIPNDFICGQLKLQLCVRMPTQI